MPSAEEIAWAAGLFEGEGSISPQGKYSVSLTINMTDRDVLERFCEVVQAGRVRSVRRTEEERNHWKPIYAWSISSKGEVQRILAMLFPWLHSRRRVKAEEMLRRLELNRGLNKDRTHCVHGHPLAGENLYLASNGRRHCQRCRNFHHRKRYEPDLDRAAV